MKKIAVLYTGGTLGMGYQGDKLAPLPFSALKEHLPMLENWQSRSFPPLYNLQTEVEQARFNPFFSGMDDFSYFSNQHQPQFLQSWQSFQATRFEQAQQNLAVAPLELDIFSWQKPLDSSSLAFSDWQTLAATIQHLSRSGDYLGFLVLHGTDTLSYTSAALSFALLHLEQPVVVTGATQPFLFPGSDALWNFYLSVVFLSLAGKGVWLCFDRSLLPGTVGSKKGGQEDFFVAPRQAWQVVVKNRQAAWLHQTEPKQAVPNSVLFRPGVLPVYFNPSLLPSDLEAIFALPIQVFLLLGYGSGNLPEHPDFQRSIMKALDENKKLVLLSQSFSATVHGKYQAGGLNLDPRILGGQDLTLEAALTKLSWLLGLPDQTEPAFLRLWQTNLAGEGSFG